jgi:hemoglobin-like flavoprotein
MVTALVKLPVMMQEQIAILKASWATVKPENKRIGFLLYEKLFSTAPFLRVMFDGDITTQACKLVAVISFVISKLHRIEDIFPDLQDIGAKHKQYRIPDNWYDVVGNCLVEALKEESGNTWNDDIEGEWRELYRLLKAQMQEGQNR